MKKSILFCLLYAFCGQASWAQIDMQQHKALIALQKFTHELTLHINSVALEGKKLDLNKYEQQFSKLLFPPFLTHLQKETKELLSLAKTDKVKFRTAQITLSENIYLAYLKINEAQTLENAYHHAEVEMSHALMTIQRTIQVCDSLQNFVYEIVPHSHTIFPAKVGKAHDEFWDTWRKIQKRMDVLPYPKRLQIYNTELLVAFQKFIDVASEFKEYLPYQPCLPYCPVEEAGAEGR